MTDLTPNDLSHLSDEEFNALAPQGYHATGPAEPLSPAAQAVLDAYFNHADLLNREVSHEEMLAAALRAAADQARDNPWPGRIESVGVMWMHDGLLAIAAELDNTPQQS
jgi:hypothetical protein